MVIMRALFAGCALTSYMWFTGSCCGQEKFPPASLMGMTGAFHVTVSGNDISGFCDAAVQWLPDGNAACYAITKSPKEKERYLYLLLIKTGLTKPGGGVRIIAESMNSDNVQNDQFEIELIDKARRVRIAYRFKTDPTTFAVQSDNALIIGDLMPKPDDPRVILIDLTAPTPFYEAVKTPFPDAVPELADREGKQRSVEDRVRVMSQAIQELKEESATVKEFLAQKPENNK
jgi:hypothetical protein